MEEKNTKTVIDEELPDTAAFEILDVLPEEEEPEKEAGTDAAGPANRKMIWIAAAVIILVIAVVFMLINK